MRVAADVQRQRDAEALYQILLRSDWKQTLLALPSAEFDSLIEARRPMICNRQHEIPELHSKSLWLDMQGSAVGMKPLYSHPPLPVTC